MKLSTYLLACLFVFVSCKAQEDDQLTNPVPTDTSGNSLTYKEKAKAVYDLIQSKYKSGTLYKENYPAQGEDRTCYLWPLVGMLRAGNLLYELGFDIAIHTKEFEGLEQYYVNRAALPGYQAEPVTHGLRDIFYDDNCIVVMELANAYRITHEEKYLTRAKEITEFIMSGEDSRMGGGMYWLESVSKDCNSGPNCIKAANTTAYGAFIGTELYKLTNDSKYLEYARRLYHWNYNTLRDTDNLYWNDISIVTGQINPTKWTYNAAMMIFSGVALYEITNESKYLDQAIATARSSYSRFTRVIDDLLFFPTHDPWFNVELMHSYIALSKYDPTSKGYVETFIKNADYAWVNARNSEGQFFEDWSGSQEGRHYWLLHQACLVEAYALAELYKN